MQVIPNQAMGYDRAITVFSPDGRILQVEYAKKAIDSGSLIMGITCKDGVVLAADTHRFDPLIVPESLSKVSEVNKNIIATPAGYFGDARVLLKKSRIKAQEHKMSYGEELSGEALVKFISDICQSFTQYGGIRPFGVSFLVGDVGEDGPRLYMTEPAGIYFQYKAKAIGSNAMEANKLLEKGWKSNLSITEGADLAKNVFKKVLGKEFQENRLQFMVTTSEGIKTMSSKK